MMQSEEFRALYDLYYADVLRFVKGLVRQQADVEEIVQDTFVQVARSYDGYRGQAQLRTWIFAIAKNRVIDHWRKSKRGHQDENVDLEAVPEHVWASNASEDPGQVVSQADEMRAVQDCIETLPASMRMVLQCRLLQGLSAVETAEVMNWSQTRVRVTYMRGLRKFREMWDQLEVSSRPPHLRGASESRVSNIPAGR